MKLFLKYVKEKVKDWLFWNLGALIVVSWGILTVILVIVGSILHNVYLIIIGFLILIIPPLVVKILDLRDSYREWKSGQND